MARYRRKQIPGAPEVHGVSSVPGDNSGAGFGESSGTSSGESSG
jgi:hypothetical protein